MITSALWIQRTRLGCEHFLLLNTAVTVVHSAACATRRSRDGRRTIPGTLTATTFSPKLHNTEH